MRLLLLLAALCPLLRAPAIITVGTVCTPSCTYSNTQLQTAIDAAVSGDIIRLTAGETFFRSPDAAFVLSNDLGSDYVTIESSAAASLPPGTRVKPSQAALMPLVCTNNANAEVIITATGAHHWRFVGINFAPCTTGLKINRDLIMAGVASNERRPDQTSHHFIFDRCWIHGYPNDEGPQRGINASADDLILMNSYIDEIHENLAGQESHAITLGAAGKNWTVINNYLAACTEASFSGGGRDSVSNRVPTNVEFLGNYMPRPGSWVTYNYNADPEGATLPDFATSVVGQTFTDTDDGSFWIRSNSGGWRRMSMPLGMSERRCHPGSLWRNHIAQTIWQCNAAGTRFVSGASDLMAPWHTTSPTSVITGATTTLNGSFPSTGWSQGSGTGLMSLSAAFAGGTGPWAALNGQKLKINRISSAQLTINFDSTGFGTGWATLAITPQFTHWLHKNGAEFKTGIGIIYEGNVIENTWPMTFQSQRGGAFVFNWVPVQDGPNATMQAMYFGNNLIRHTVTGLLASDVQQDSTSSGSNIITGTTTRLQNVGSFFGRIGEAYFFEGGTGAWSDLASTTRLLVQDTGTSQGGTLGFQTFTVNYDSTGKSTSGITLRWRDDSHEKPNRWPENWLVANNLMEIAGPMTMTGIGSFQTVYDDGTNGQATSEGVSFQTQYSATYRNNTTIRRAIGADATWFANTFMEGARLEIHTDVDPADAFPQMDLNLVDNVDDGSAGRMLASANTGHACQQLVDQYWTPNNGRVRMAGNVATYGDKYSSMINSINLAGYGGPTCLNGWNRMFGRSDPAFLTTESDGSVTVSGGPSAPVATFTFPAAPRILGNSTFCVTSSTPSDLVGCFRVPSTVDAATTTWTNVALPGVPNGIYNSVVLSSAIRFQDFANGNYRLAANSPVKGMGQDGGDPGADIDVVGWATETAISGLPNPYLTTYVLSIEPSDTSATICYNAYDSSAATLTVATTRSYTPDVGTDGAETRTGRRGCRTVSGLTANTKYYVRLNVTGARYRDTLRNGRFAVFHTKPFAVSEDDYLNWVDQGARTLKSTVVGTPVKYGCFLVIAGANGYVADFPAIYENLTAWIDAVDNLAAAGCSRIAINVDMTPWIANDATDIQRYKDIFQYIVTTKGLELEISPPGSGLAKAAIQKLPACPNGGAPCYDGSFNSPDDWFNGAKAAMAAMAQLPASQHPIQINVAHEVTTTNSELGITGSIAQWSTVVANFANDATYGIQTVDTSIVVSVGCHIGEYLYCQNFSDLAGIDRIGINVFDHMNINAMLFMISDALAADGTPKDAYILASAPPFMTNDYVQNEVNAIHGVGWATAYTPVCFACFWMDGFIRRVTNAGVTGINVFWTQPFRYYALAGEDDKGLSSVYNGKVQNTPDTTLTNYGQYLRDHPLLQ